MIAASQGGPPCIDELEIYGPDGGRNLGLAADGARATASSCLPGYAIHQVANLNDGRYGNDHSWIAATAGREWAQIELARPVDVAKIVHHLLDHQFHFVVVRDVGLIRLAAHAELARHRGHGRHRVDDL